MNIRERIKAALRLTYRNIDRGRDHWKVVQSWNYQIPILYTFVWAKVYMFLSVYFLGLLITHLLQIALLMHGFYTSVYKGICNYCTNSITTKIDHKETVMQHAIGCCMWTLQMLDPYLNLPRLCPDVCWHRTVPGHRHEPCCLHSYTYLPFAHQMT